MKKYIGIALAVLMVLGLTTIALTDLPPYQGGLPDSSTTTNWSGSGHFWGSTNYAGIGTAAFDTAGDWCNGSYKANTYTASGVSLSILNPYAEMLGTQMKAEVGNGYINYTQTRLGPDPVWYGASAPPGQVSTSFIGVDDGTGEMAMTTMSGGFGNLSEDNFGGVKAALGGHYQANLVADVNPTTGYFEMNRQLMASDGDYVRTYAEGSGHVYLEALSSNMSPSEATVDSYYSGFHADTAGWGNFSLEGSGTNRVTKHLGFSTSGSTTWTAIDGSDVTGFYNNGDGTTQGSAFLGIYASWDPGTATPNTGFDMSDTGMTAN